MSKRSVNPYQIAKRSHRKLQILDLQYEWAKEDKRDVYAEAILRAATKLQGRIQTALGLIMLEKRRDEREAHEINNQMKEKENAITSDSGPDSRPDSEGTEQLGEQLAGEPEGQS
jgi:hypothetical protein